MDEIKASLIDAAISIYGEIYPCGTHETLDECFTIHNDELLFWFNCSEKSTHILKKKFE